MKQKQIKQQMFRVLAIAFLCGGIVVGSDQEAAEASPQVGVGTGIQASAQGLNSTGPVGIFQGISRFFTEKILRLDRNKSVVARELSVELTEKRIKDMREEMIRERLNQIAAARTLFTSA